MISSSSPFFPPLKLNLLCTLRFDEVFESDACSWKTPGASSLSSSGSYSNSTSVAESSPFFSYLGGRGPRFSASSTEFLISLGTISYRMKF